MIDLCYPPVDEEHGKGETPETKLGELNKLKWNPLTNQMDYLRHVLQKGESKIQK